MIWLLVPLCGLLSQMGGSDYFPKAFRRIGIPLLMALAVWYFKGFSWVLLPFALTQWAVYTIPFTLIGDGIPEHWFNWVWIWIWATLKCLPALWINHSVWVVIPFCAAILAIMASLSNVKPTARWFQWKLVEFMNGACPAVVLCFSVLTP